MITLDERSDPADWFTAIGLPDIREVNVIGCNVGGVQLTRHGTELTAEVEVSAGDAWSTRIIRFKYDYRMRVWHRTN